ncbi:MAG: cbb3-type cytochrome c oxidase N-terminal domain-containing protein [Methylophilaceae bacterium]
MSQDKTKSAKVTTTGHKWDDNLEEFSNPLPRWWVWTFYLTAIFTVVYWLFYPAWPIGNTYTIGIPGWNSISYTATQPDGKEVQKSTHWNMRALLAKDMNDLHAKQKQYFDKVAALPYEQVAKDAELMQFVNSAGKTLFSDNCKPCHQAGGQGKITFAPNLIDDSWMYGGSYEKIHQTLTGGRRGFMPAFKEVLSDVQITQLANYVLSLSGDLHDAKAAKAGDALFHGETAACYFCHGADGKGKVEMGSANLADKIWLWVNIPEDKTVESKVADVKSVINAGLNRGVMPNWDTRLKPEQIKLLTVYVHDSLGGGK